MFLTPDELHQLTGYKGRTAQTKWLVENSWPFIVGGDGNPKLLRVVVLARLGAGKAEIVKRTPQLVLDDRPSRQAPAAIKTRAAREDGKRN